MDKWNRSLIANHLAGKNVEWRFIPPRTPHQGGVWERMVGTVKKVLRSISKARLMHQEELRTMLVVAEGIVNSRPLTPCSSDPRDLEPLTPNHLLLLRGGADFPFTRLGEDYDAVKGWKFAREVSEMFWHRWVTEYLTLLQARRRWLKPRKVAVGDMVLLDFLPSATSIEKHLGWWPVARVTNLIPSDDGLVRNVRVKAKGGHEVLRSVNHTFPLESQVERWEKDRLAQEDVDEQRDL